MHDCTRCIFYIIGGTPLAHAIYGVESATQNVVSARETNKLTNVQSLTDHFASFSVPQVARGQRVRHP